MQKGKGGFRGPKHNNANPIKHGDPQSIEQVKSGFDGLTDTINKLPDNAVRSTLLNQVGNTYVAAAKALWGMAIGAFAESHA